MIEFRMAANFAGYRVAADGSLWSSLQGGKWKERTLIRDGNGYLKASLRRDGKYVVVSMHSLMLESFVGPRPEGMIACHNNGNSSDNRIENLRWDTHKSNARDTILHRRQFMESFKRSRSQSKSAFSR